MSSISLQHRRHGKSMLMKMGMFQLCWKMRVDGLNWLERGFIEKVLLRDVLLECWVVKQRVVNLMLWIFVFLRWLRRQNGMRKWVHQLHVALIIDDDMPNYIAFAS